MKINPSVFHSSLIEELSRKDVLKVSFATAITSSFQIVALALMNILLGFKEEIMLFYKILTFII